MQTQGSSTTTLRPLILAGVSGNANGSSEKSLGTKLAVDCAKECPCGVPTIPVPDQWLEVMVSGGFKVWHIVFIIIALVVTLVVVYCCFHRCRIPRTKQEIEADLMRSNMSTKFSEYLQEFPNEPVTFVEALKRVQELEEKLELDDARVLRESGARKRMGWLRLKGKQQEQEGKKEEKQEEEQRIEDVDIDKQANETDKAESKIIEEDNFKSNKQNIKLSGQEIEANHSNMPNGKVSKRETSSKEDKKDVSASADSNKANSIGQKSSTSRRRKGQKPNLKRTKEGKSGLRSHVIELEQANVEGFEVEPRATSTKNHVEINIDEEKVEKSESKSKGNTNKISTKQARADSKSQRANKQIKAQTQTNVQFQSNSEMLTSVTSLSPEMKVTKLSNNNNNNRSRNRSREKKVKKEAKIREQQENVIKL